MHPKLLFNNVSTCQPEAAYDLLARHLPTYNAAEKTALNQCLQDEPARWASSDTLRLFSSVVTAETCAQPWPPHPNPARACDQAVVLHNPASLGNRVMLRRLQERDAERLQEQTAPPQAPAWKAHNTVFAKVLKTMFAPVYRVVEDYKRSKRAANASALLVDVGVTAQYVPPADVVRDILQTKGPARTAVAQRLDLQELEQTQRMLAQTQPTQADISRARITAAKAVEQFAFGEHDCAAVVANVKAVMLRFHPDQYNTGLTPVWELAAAVGVHVLARHALAMLGDPAFVQDLRSAGVLN